MGAPLPTNFLNAPADRQQIAIFLPELIESLSPLRPSLILNKARRLHPGQLRLDNVLLRWPKTPLPLQRLQAFLTPEARIPLTSVPSQAHAF
ncbi:hypothetical protein D3C74_409910 [compost metagenome]